MPIPPKPWKVVTASVREGHFLVDKDNNVVLTGVHPKHILDHIANAVNSTPEASNCLCVVCGTNPVSPEFGEDTCQVCTKKWLSVGT